MGILTVLSGTNVGILMGKIWEITHFYGEFGNFVGFNGF